MAQTLKVSITNFKFDPAALQIAVGDSVQWSNDSPNQQHSATSDDGGKTFDSKLLDPMKPGQPPSSFTYTFKTAGTYPYHCTKHTNMKGTVTVQ
jgi:plastocyanin